MQSPNFVQLPIDTELSRRHSLLREIMAGVAAPNSLASGLPNPETCGYPIPYFGDPSRALIATIGVNPSATEFGSNRWSRKIDVASDLDAVLVQYFNDPSAPPHPWFSGWSNVLRMLGHSYSTDAVHLDLSPRATKAMRSIETDTFVRMVANDLLWLPSTLGLCPQIRGALISGSVTKKYYIDEFLRRYLRSPWSLKLTSRLGDAHRGATSLYELVGPDRHIPVFFCSTSPSGDGGVRLASEVRRHLSILLAAGF
jgi:hypothetical protein